MRGEDHSPPLDLAQPGQSIGLVDEGDALLLEIIGRVGVVDEHAEHVHRPFSFLAHAFGDPKGVHHAVAVAPGRDLDYFHSERVYVEGLVA